MNHRCRGGKGFTPWAPSCSLRRGGLLFQIGRGSADGELLTLHGLYISYEAASVGAKAVALLAAVDAGIADVAVFHTQQACSAHEECHLVVGCRHKMSLLIDNLHKDVGYRVGSHLQGVRLFGGSYLVGCTVVGLTAQCARLVVDVPEQNVGILVALGLTSYFLAVEQQAGRLGIGIAYHTHLGACVIVPHGGSVWGRALWPVWSVLTITPVAHSPAGTDIADGLLAPQGGTIPSQGLTLSSQVEQSCRRTSCRPLATLAQIVDACPQELAEDMGIVCNCLPCSKVVTVL